MEKVGTQVAQAAIPSVLKTRMNPLSGSLSPAGDIETGGLGGDQTGNEEENLSLPQRALAKFLRYDLEDKILAFVGVACFLAGIVCLATSTLLGVGFIVASLCIAWCFRRINLLELYKSLACSVDTLQAENEELRGHVDELQSKLVELNTAVDELETVKNGLDEQLTTFREINDLVGEQGDEMIKSLNDTYSKYKDENERHKNLLEQQSDFHFYQILQHFDKDFSGSIEEGEIDGLVLYLKNKYPDFDESEIRSMGKTVPMKDLKQVLMKIGDWK